MVTYLPESWLISNNGCPAGLCIHEVPGKKWILAMGTTYMESYFLTLYCLSKARTIHNSIRTELPFFDWRALIVEKFSSAGKYWNHFFHHIWATSLPSNSCSYFIATYRSALKANSLPLLSVNALETAAMMKASCWFLSFFCSFIIKTAYQKRQK